MTVAVISYSAAALAYFGLLMLLLTGSIMGTARRSLLLAVGASLVWGIFCAAHGSTYGLSDPVSVVVEVVRKGAWFALVIAVALTLVHPKLVRLAQVLAVGLLLIEVAISLVPPAWLASHAEQATILVCLAFAFLGLTLLGYFYRNATQEQRRSTGFLMAAIGIQFAYEFLLYAQAELFGQISRVAWDLRGLVATAAVPLILVAMNRTREWNAGVFVSRQVVFYSTAFFVIGVYLLVVAMAGHYVLRVGDDRLGPAQILFIASAGLVLVSLSSSRNLRRRLRVFISKHFYRNKYDYRLVWRQFVNKLASVAPADVRSGAIEAVASVFSSPYGLLFIADDSSTGFECVSIWPPERGTDTWPPRIEATDELVAAFLARGWIVDVEEYRRSPDSYDNIALPAWLDGWPAARFISPVMRADRLVAILIMASPPPPFDLMYEDRDLFMMLGQHVATLLAQHDADRKIAENRQFEAYNRLSAFVMHDLKNAVAQMQLVVANAERHKRNPDFVDDTIETIGNALRRINLLVGQLRPGERSAGKRAVVLQEILQTVIERRSVQQPAPQLSDCVPPVLVEAQPDELASALEHAIRNAQDATPALGIVRIALRLEGGRVTVTITDNGAGMDAQFLRERLFRCFDTTKGSAGMGIGAYQTREYVRSLGGRVDVQSTPGRGTRFAITLPVSESRVANG
jgi:putative PEP-CTERM system histidine kinase